MSNIKNNRILVVLALLIILVSSCRDTTTINSHYIYNTGWNDGLYQGFTIAKIRLLDSSISVFDKNFNKYNLADYIIDSSFCFFPSPRDNPNDKIKKVFFDKKNDFGDWRYCGNAYITKPTLGSLENNTWFIILGLKGTIDFYVHIDNKGNSHVYSLGPTNW
jgi:hypothetical protein